MPLNCTWKGRRQRRKINKNEEFFHAQDKDRSEGRY
jgi:hypothetical protein